LKKDLDEKEGKLKELKSLLKKKHKDLWAFREKPSVDEYSKESGSINQSMKYIQR